VRRILWRKRALSDLEQIHGWLTSIEGAKPNRAIRRIHNAANALARLGDIGRPSRVEGVRELSVRGAPYVIVYRFDGRQIDVLAVYHTAQDRS
jgi:toxin ParE1/3/4